MATRPDIEQEWPPGDPESFTCRHCGGHRHLTPGKVGRRALVCAVCDAPDPSTLVGR